MAELERVICSSSELTDGGKGVRFAIQYGGRTESAFAVRYDGKVYAYLNLCAHRPQELDYPEGEFFDTSGLYLVCSIHGAAYRPDTGRCVMGPCGDDEGLISLRVEERDSKVFLISKEESHG